MRTAKQLIWFWFILSLLLLERVNATNREQFSGNIFADYTYVLRHHASAIQGFQGFWFRRIYLTYDRKVEGDAAARLRLELSDPGDFAASTKLVPALKDAYISWKRGKRRLTFGLSPTPTWDKIEKLWGYRSVEKTPLDLQKMGSSRDLGIKIDTSIGRKQTISYTVMFANGNSNKSKGKKGGKVMGAIYFSPNRHLFFEAYADYHSNNSTRTFQLFSSYKVKHSVLGLQYAAQKNQILPRLRLLSLFAHWKQTHKTAFLLRYDLMLDANPNGDKIAYTPYASTAKASLLLAGVALSIQTDLTLIPNIEFVHYRQSIKGSPPKNNLYAKLTLAYKW